MSTLLTFLVIIGAYFLGFLTAAMLSAGSKADEWADGYRQGRFGKDDADKHSLASEEEV